MIPPSPEGCYTISIIPLCDSPKSLVCFKLVALKNFERVTRIQEKKHGEPTES